MSKIKRTVAEKTTAKERCVNFLTGLHLFKTVVFVICLAVVVQQVTACIRKLINKPITTYTHFDFNNTLAYPSVTFCREPPYKFEKLLDYDLFAHPRFTSTWRDFDFTKYSLDQLWADISYNKTDYFIQYGLNSSADNVEVTPAVGFVLGTCYTLNPKVLSSKASRETGFSVTLRHSHDDVATSTSVYPPGYHVYIHYQREPFTEVVVNNGGLVDYLYVNTGEVVDIKLTVDEYVKIADEEDDCTHQENYSANACTTEYVWDKVVEVSGCDGPWMNTSMPACTNYTQMRDLITAYINYYQNHECTLCPRFCQSLLYNGFVTNRQSEFWWDSTVQQWRARVGDEALQIQLYIHFNSMMVSVYEERYNYDWNLFLSDLGGSIGFLLGLSVIGLIKVIEKIWTLSLGPWIKSFRTKKDNISEADTVEIERQVKVEYIRKCEDWHKKNDLYAICDMN